MWFYLGVALAGFDPWNATAPMDWWTIINRCRAIENTVYVVAGNQAASLKYYPPYLWSGGSQIVDYEERLLADASSGPGKRIVAPIDVSAFRHERETRRGHSFLAHLRAEAYPVYQKHFYPPQSEENSEEMLSFEKNNELID
jgi:predicted amidohydrolase